MQSGTGILPSLQKSRVSLGYMLAVSSAFEGDPGIMLKDGCKYSRGVYKFDR